MTNIDLWPFERLASRTRVQADQIVRSGASILVAEQHTIVAPSATSPSARDAAVLKIRERETDVLSRYPDLSKLSVYYSSSYTEYHSPVKPGRPRESWYTCTVYFAYDGKAAPSHERDKPCTK